MAKATTGHTAIIDVRRTKVERATDTHRIMTDNSGLHPWLELHMKVSFHPDCLPENWTAVGGSAQCHRDKVHCHKCHLIRNQGNPGYNWSWGYRAVISYSSYIGMPRITLYAILDSASYLPFLLVVSVAALRCCRHRHPVGGKLVGVTTSSTAISGVNQSGVIHLGAHQHRYRAESLNLRRPLARGI